MDWIADYSFAHDTLTGALLAQLGAAGAIGYVSDNPDKNLTAANLADLLAHGLAVGLVFEDSELDMTTGYGGGLKHGRTAMQQAAAIGYDAANCVMFAADDRNTGYADWPMVLAYMNGFAVSVPHPGYYGDQDSIDWLAAHRRGLWNWQSNSTSFGTGISRNAHLVQRYADPRARGLSLDVNDIQREGVPFMATDGFTQADRDMLANINNQVTAPAGLIGRLGANILKVAQQIEDAGHTDVAAQLDALRSTLNAVDVPADGSVDPHEFAADVASEFARRLGVTPPA